MRVGLVSWRASSKWTRVSIGIVILMCVLVIWRDSISRWLLPDSRLNHRIELAEAALLRGDLSRSDGGGARELFESVLAVDPDYLGAHAGLARVREATVNRIVLALKAGRASQARSALALAEEMSVPDLQLQPLRLQLHSLESSARIIPDLLEQAARTDLTDRQVLAIYERILDLEAKNTFALEGRRALLSAWLDRAIVLAADNDFEKARQLVNAVIAYDPEHLELPQTQAILGDAYAKQQRAQHVLLAEAQSDENAGRIDEAARKYLRLQHVHGLELSRVGLLRCANEFAHRAEKSAADFDFKRAEYFLSQARRWSPSAPAIVFAEQRIEQSRIMRERLLRKPTREELARLPKLVSEANAALERGQLIDPPGLSAWDKLRVAFAIAPQSPSVIRLQVSFRNRVRECFENALIQNQLRHAQACLEAWLTLNPTVESSMESAKHRLAERWLAYAEERISATDYDAAEQALGFAEKWQVDISSLTKAYSRLRQARGQR